MQKEEDTVSVSDVIFTEMSSTSCDQLDEGQT